MSKNTTLKRYLISSGITFLTAFVAVILPTISTISLSDLKDGALAGVLFVAIRAGIKAVLESTLVTLK